MSEPTVSVVIPAYNAAGTLARTLQSVLGQTHPPAEVLVVNDGSTDDTSAVAAGFGERVTLIEQPNGGAASARNRGLEAARAELVAFIDADDYWAPHKLARCREAFAQHAGLGLVASRYAVEAPGGAPRVVRQRAPIPAGAPAEVSGARAFALAAAVWTGSVVVRRAVVGEERFVSGLEPAEDRDFWFRMILKAPVMYLDEPLATAVLVPGSLSRTNVDRDCGNMLRVVRRHRAALGPLAARRWEGRVYERWAGVHLSEGRPGEALGYAARRLWRWPLSTRSWWTALKAGTQVALGRGGRGGDGIENA